MDVCGCECVCAECVRGAGFIEQQYDTFMIKCCAVSIAYKDMPALVAELVKEGANAGLTDEC